MIRQTTSYPGKTSRRVLVGATMVAALLTASCGKLDPLQTRHAAPASAGSQGDSAERIVYLEQGWSPIDSALFYTSNQGSRLVPYGWFLALEQPTSEQLFRDNRNIDRLRFLPRKPSPLNPHGLPVGFVKDPAEQPGKIDWLGLTCAACHTAQVNYKGVGYRIDGGPGLGDIQTLLHELTASLQATHDDDARFARFAARVLADSDQSPESLHELRTKLGEVAIARREFDQRNATDHPYGYARVDAFGIILNEVLQHSLKTPGDRNQRPPNAPVSYPFLWDTPHHDFVQWNGAAPNRVLGTHKLGPLARNVGEVLGVFGEVEIPATGKESRYRSSAEVLKLIEIEERLRKLQSPEWPAEFPPIQPQQRAAGEALFIRYCVDCHRPLKRSDPTREVVAQMIPLDKVGTDPRMALNFAEREGSTGPLKGRAHSPLNPEPLGDSAAARDILKHVVAGVIANSSPLQKEHHAEALRLLKQTKAWGEWQAFLDRPPGSQSPAYKARPLNGIWATAPYLHNGSVPNLFELLLPAAERSKQFYVGRREFDPVKVGFVADKSPDGGFLFRTRDEKGELIPGNSNAGHEYGTGADNKPPLAPDERWQIVEYLKSL